MFLTVENAGLLDFLAYGFRPNSSFGASPLLLVLMRYRILGTIKSLWVTLMEQNGYAKL